MTEQGRVLAGLRAFIAEYGEAERVHVVSQMLGNGTAGIQERLVGIKRGHIETELAAVEARLEKFKRFVRAMDAWWLAYTDDDVLGNRYVQASDEVKAARAALTDEDLA